MRIEAQSGGVARQSGGVARQGGTDQVVMIGIGRETFALEASFVREISDPIPVTRVAGARPHLSSVINVRGNVVPLADIRQRFGMADTADTADTRFVVIEIAIDGDPVTVGLVADRVHEVTEITRADAQQIPRIGTSWRPEYIRSIVKWRDEFVIIPELEAILH